MSLFNTMRTAVSGMQAQSNALSTIGDNIANSGTTGYKKATAEFETALGVNATSEYESGGVQTDVRYNIAGQGTLTASTSTTDLAISGNGFFSVSKDGNGQYLTRAGSFVPNSNTGTLVNAAGYELMGYKMLPSGPATTLSPVSLSSNVLNAQASSTGALSFNAPSTATAATGTLPSSNQAGSTYTDKTSLTVYDSLGQANVLDVYLTKTGSNTWEAAAYKQSDAATSGGFPYAPGGAGAAVGVSTLTFDGKTGALASTTAADVNGNQVATKPADSLSVAVNGTTVPIDLSSSTQLAASWSVNQQSVDGHSASTLKSVSIGQDGTVTAVYNSGAQIPTYKIPLANVASPDNLTPLNGNVYQANTNSGPVVTSDANSGVLGSIQAGQLESSTVDLATELTNMIQAQRGYEANSKVLQAGSDLLGVLNRITTN